MRPPGADADRSDTQPFSRLRLGKYAQKRKEMSFDAAFNSVWHTMAAKFRKRRQRKFLAAFPPDRFRSIIDVGGLVSHWREDPRPILVVNLVPQQNDCKCTAVVGDGRRLEFGDRSFDLAYSNSAIEHVGRWEDQTAFASELRRVGKAVYCQTPNRWFPIEVHYLTFFLHWKPSLLRNYFIARYLTIWGWLVRPTPKQVAEYADSVNLLSAAQLQQLFPGCTIEREKFCGLTKSLIVKVMVCPGSTPAECNSL